MSAEITPAMVAELVQRLRREYPASMYSRVRGHAFVGSHAWATLDLWDTLDALESCRTELEQARIELEDERERVNVQREDIRTLRLEVQRLTEEARRSDAGRVVVPEIERWRLRLGSALESSEALMEYVERPPDRNCSCHISPPCSDCVDNSHLRNAIEDIEDMRKWYNEHCDHSPSPQPSANDETREP